MAEWDAARYHRISDPQLARGRSVVPQLPENLGASFIAQLTAMAAADDRPLTLEYWRLNITARKPLS
jgi:hypothetical protein